MFLKAVPFPYVTEIMSETNEQSYNSYGTAKEDIMADCQALFFAMRSMTCYPWRRLETEMQSADSSQILTELLEKTCLHPLCQRYPPSVKYRRRFLSELIKRHEEMALEPLDELYNALGAVLGLEEQPVCYKNYFLPAGDAVSLLESEATISEGTTGMVTWDAGLYLAEWALQNPQVFDGRAVLELGSGVGLTGVVVCRSCQPERYTFSDCHPGVLCQLRENVKLNGLEGSGDPLVAVEELDWVAVTDKRLQDLRPDTVIAADVVYDPGAIDALVALLIRLLACPVLNRPPDIYIVSTVRNPNTYAYFRSLCDKGGLQHQVIAEPVGQVFPYSRNPPIEMIRLHL